MTRMKDHLADIQEQATRAGASLGLVEIVREAAGNMCCYHQDVIAVKVFDGFENEGEDDTCGVCTSCRARALIAKIDGA